MAEMTAAQRRFVDLERQVAEAKKFFADLNEAAQAVANESGMGAMWQDNEGVVYQVVEAKGKWVAFEPISYVRTKRDGETQSPHPLAKKTAQAAGFEVE